eukprot:scaffold1538_cov109-Cylindrotheca_fusiformis.AAC.6
MVPVVAVGGEYTYTHKPRQPYPYHRKEIQVLPSVSDTMTRDHIWESRFQELVDWKNKHGHCEVPQKNGSLGRWVHRQRENKHKNNLSLDRETKLNELGFVWRQKTSRPTDTWDERYDQLVDYKNEHGDCNVPQSYEEIPGLGRWVNRQRTAKAKSELDPERISKLKSLGFSFNTKNFLWEARFRELVDFKNKTGHCDVPYGWNENKELSKWVQKQRYLYTLKTRGSKSNLTDEREEKLRALGFVWNASSTSWDTHYHALCQYKLRFGNCNVPRPYPENPKLSNWVYNHRSEYSRKRRGLKNNLTAGREAKLNAIGFAWVLKLKTNEEDDDQRHDDRDDVTSSGFKRGNEWLDSDDRTDDSSSKRRGVDDDERMGSSPVASPRGASKLTFDADQVLVASQLLTLKSL